MRRNPAGDWTIEDVRTVCRQHGVNCTAPKRGAHYKVSHAGQAEILTIPARRPIKPIYIRALVAFLSRIGGSLDG
jgi:hypothetical protein